MTLHRLRRVLPAVFALALATPLAVRAQSSPADLPDAPSTTAAPRPEPVANGPTIVIDTTLGRLTCKTFPQFAPNAVANFIGLAEGTKEWTDNTTHLKQRKRFYDGLAFHRVIPGFMIQAGDPVGDGSGDPGYLFADEIDPGLTFSVPGRLAMANSGPGTNGSQFFITEQPFTDGNGKYTIFGQCDAASVQLVTAIAAVPRNRDDKPLTPVLIQHVFIVRDGGLMPPTPIPATLPQPVPAPPAIPPTIPR
jgi:peptidyl-prolyl cis-trans isomerase A (cyclophilin A)